VTSKTDERTSWVSSGDAMTSTVLVTGAAGYVGRAVCEAASSQGSDVVALVRAPGLPAANHPRVRVIVVDWNDQQSLLNAVADVTPDSIIHCAGLPGIPECTATQLYESNVAAVWRLLDGVSAVGLDPTIVLVSSAAVYGASGARPIPEVQTPAPVGHYGWSKLIAEQVGMAFRTSAGLHVMYARPFNITGLDERAGSVVSRIATQLRHAPRGERMTVRVWEDKSVRDFVDVRDVACALLRIAERGVPGSAYNVCTGVGTSVRELIESACTLAGCSPEVIIERPDAVPTVSVGDPRALEELGWCPAFDLHESLRSVMQSAEDLPGAGAPERGMNPLS